MTLESLLALPLPSSRGTARATSTLDPPTREWLDSRTAYKKAFRPQRRPLTGRQLEEVEVEVDIAEEIRLDKTYSNMVKSSSRKSVLSAAGAAVTCVALLLTVLAQQRRSAHGDARGDAEVGMRSLQSVAQMDGEVQSDQAAHDEGKKGFSAYFSKLTRSRRAAEKPTAADAGAASSAPAEELRPDDLFIAVKTTKKFHQPRLDLLLETWISRNVQQVSFVSNLLLFSMLPKQFC